MICYKHRSKPNEVERMALVGDVKGKARTLQRGGEMAGEPVGGFRSVGLAAAQFFYQVAGIDAYRATLRA